MKNLTSPEIMLKQKKESWCRFVVLAIPFILCFWPTYLAPGVAPHTMQKSHFFIILAITASVVLATKVKVKVPIESFILLTPLAMMLIIFPYSIDYFSFFHISVLIKPVLIFLYCIFFYSLFIRFFYHSNLKGFASALTALLICQLIFIGLQVALGDHPALMIFNHKEVETGFGVRAPGTFDWVYITCYFLSFYLIYQLLDLLMFKKSLSNLIILFFILIAIVLSQSKTGYLATLLICIYFFCFSIYAQIGIAKKLFMMFIVATVSLTSVIILLGIEFQYIEKFIELITEGRMDASTSTRKKQIILALSEGLNNWYSGSPLAFKGIIIENAYLDYLFRYGILGLLLYLFVLGFMIIYSGWVAGKVVKLYKSGRESQYTVKLAISAHLSMIAATLYSFTGTPIDAYKCAIWSSFIFSMVIFLNYRSYKKFN